MITHAASPKTFLYCFIEPPRLGTLFLWKWRAGVEEGGRAKRGEKVSGGHFFSPGETPSVS